MAEITEEHEIPPTEVAVVVDEGVEDTETARSTTVCTCQLVDVSKPHWASSEGLDGWVHCFNGEPCHAVEDVDQDRLYATDQAGVWAEEFAKVSDEDQGFMIGWFANLAETAKTLEARRILEKLASLDPTLGEEIIESWTLHKLTDETPPTAAELLLVLYKAATNG